jgi:uncharacterized membrane protein YgdD (TMEM256/DUF423 family)
MDTSEQSNRNPRRKWPIVVGIVLFGALMALRYELPSMWMRTAVAACAFFVLGWVFLMCRRNGA